MTIIKIMLDELNSVFRRKIHTALLLFGVPLGYVVLFGLTYSADVILHIPTVVCDLDNTALSRTLVQVYSDSERYDIIAQVSTEEEANQYLSNQTALCAVIIPTDFGQNIKLGKASELLVQTNAANLLFANSVLTSSQEIVQTFVTGIGQKLLEGSNYLPAKALYVANPMRLGIRILNNPTTSYSNFILIGMTLNGLQIALILVTSTLITLNTVNAKPWRLVIGKLLAYWLTANFIFVGCILVLIGVFGIPLKGSLLQLLLVNSGFSLAIIGVGLLCSSLANNRVTAIQLPILYIMPSFLFSGYSWPHLAMNEFSYYFSSILPITYAADTMRDILLAGYAPDIIINTLILYCFGIVFTVSSIVIFAIKHKANREAMA